MSASIIAYLLLLDLGVGNAITRYVAKFRVNGETEQSRKFLGVATIYYSTIALISLIIGITLIAVFPKAFARGLTASEIKLGQELLFITMINAAFTLGTAAYNNVIIAYEQYAVSKGVQIIQIIVRMALTVFMLKCGFGSVGIVTINLLMTVLCRGFFVLFVLFKLNLRPMFKGIDIPFVKEIVLYSSMILIQMIATQLNSTVDQILIGSLVASSSTILAVYSVGTQITQYYQSIGTAFTGVLMPGIVKMVESGTDPKALTDEMIRIGRIILIVLGPIWGGFFVCGQQFITLWAGADNANAFYVAVILMTAYMLILTESIGTQILWAMNQHKEQAILKGIIVLLNIFLTIILIKWQPLIGATIGTFISLILGDVVVMNIIFRKKLKMNLCYYYSGLAKGIIPSVVIATAVGFSVSYFLKSSGWIYLLIEVTIICLEYAACILLFGMNAYEKKLVLSILRKVKFKGDKL